MQHYGLDPDDLEDFSHLYVRSGSNFILVEKALDKLLDKKLTPTEKSFQKIIK